MHVGHLVQLYENELDNLSKAPQLSVFIFKAFLNIGVLLTGSEKPTAAASFCNMVNMLDEMKICGIKRYTLMDVDEREEKMIAER